MLAFGTIAACNMIYLRQTLSIAAYEGGRTAIAVGATSDSVVSDCEQILADRGVSDATVSIDPPTVESTPVGEFIEVSVTAPCDSNSILGAWFTRGHTVTGRSEFRKKY